MKKNRRIQSFALLILAAVLLAVIAVLGSFWQEAAIGTDFTRKNLPEQSGEKISLLIVDDNPKVLRLLERAGKVRVKARADVAGKHAAVQSVLFF